MKYADRSQKLQCYLTTSLPWRNHDDYECTFRKTIVDEHDKSLLNPYPFSHLSHLHLQFLSQALQKTPLMSTQGPGNPLLKSKTIPNQLLRATMMRAMRNSPFGDGSALQLSTIGKAESIGVPWDVVGIVDQQAMECDGARKGWCMTQRQGFGIPTNLERFDLRQGQCYDFYYLFFSSRMFTHLFSFQHAWIVCRFTLLFHVDWCCTLMAVLVNLQHCFH